MIQTAIDECCASHVVMIEATHSQSRWHPKHNVIMVSSIFSAAIGPALLLPDDTTPPLLIVKWICLIGNRNLTANDVPPICEEKLMKTVSAIIFLILIITSTASAQWKRADDLVEDAPDQKSALVVN